MCICVHVCLYSVFLVRETYLYQTATWGADTTVIYGEVAAFYTGSCKVLVAHWCYLGSGRMVLLCTYVHTYT